MELIFKLIIFIYMIKGGKMENKKELVADQLQRTVRVLSRFPVLENVIDDTQTLFRLVHSYREDSYRDISVVTFGLIIFGLIYFISPVDLFPDFIYALGWVDDIAILGFISSHISSEIDEYRQWEVRMEEYGEKVNVDEVTGNVTLME